MFSSIDSPHMPPHHLSASSNAAPHTQMNACQSRCQPPSRTNSAKNTSATSFSTKIRNARCSSNAGRSLFARHRMWRLHCDQSDALCARTSWRLRPLGPRWILLGALDVRALPALLVSTGKLHFGNCSRNLYRLRTEILLFSSCISKLTHFRGLDCLMKGHCGLALNLFLNF